MHTVLIVIVVIGIIGYVIGRQLRGEPIRGKRLILLPLIVAVIGAVDLSKDHTDHVQAIDIVLIAVSAVLAALIGLAQGAIMRLENRGGALWGQLPVKGLWLWGAFIAVRVGIEIGAHAADAHLAASTAPLLLVLGINRLGQAGVIALRATNLGIPFAPEKDGSTFLAGTVQSTNSGPKSNEPPHPAPPNAAPTNAAPTNAAPANPAPTSAAQQLASSFGSAVQDRRSQRRQRRGRR